jgi:cyanate lyase
LIYRFYEIMMVYAMARESVIRERFGDGGMSAIDFKRRRARRGPGEGDHEREVLALREVVAKPRRRICR